MTDQGIDTPHSNLENQLSFTGVTIECGWGITTEAEMTAALPKSTSTWETARKRWKPRAPCTACRQLKTRRNVLSRWVSLSEPLPGSKAGVLVMATIVIKYRGQSNLGNKGFICLMLPHHCSVSKELSTGAQAGQELEAGADAEVMEKCLLVYF